MSNKKKTIIWCAVTLILLVVFATIPGKVGTSKRYQKRVIKPLVTKSKIVSINIAIDQYKVDTGVYPQSMHGLKSLNQDFGTDNWSGPYLQNESYLADQWGQPLYYELMNNIPIVISSGPDGELGTYDDIETGVRGKLSQPPN